MRRIESVVSLPSSRFLVLLFGCTTIGFVLMWATNYPVDDWAGAVLVWSIAFSASRIVTAYLFARVADSLSGPASRFEEQMGRPLDEMADGSRVATMSNQVVGIWLTMSLLAIVLGASLTAYAVVAPRVGLTAVGQPFIWWSVALLAIGVVSQSLIYGVIRLAFKLAASMERKEESDERPSESQAPVPGLATALTALAVAFGIFDPS